MSKYRIGVWHRLDGEQRYIGEMACVIENGKMSGAFRYDTEYIRSTAFFPLDPVSLSPFDRFIVDEPFDPSPHGVFKVFEDSLPDDWGRRLMVRKFNIQRANQNVPYLLLLIGSSGLGALSYAEYGTEPPESAPEESTLLLSDLVDAAEAYENGALAETGLKLLFAAGSSPGGARPKALVYGQDDGAHYLAKFPSNKDDVNVVRIEAATMSLAGKAGLVVPKTRLASCGKRDVLLVERFDIFNDSSRRHMISMQTLLKADGHYQSRYYEILKAIRMYGSDPVTDCDLLFRQMVFNAVIGNTDDHLKNFWMTYCHNEGWRLSPSFDLVPDIRRSEEHILFFEDGPYYPGRKKLERIGKSWGVSNAASIVQKVFDAVSRWREVYAEFGVPEVDINTFREIDKHLVSTS